MSTAARNIAPELLDHAGPAGALHSLRDLVKINRWLGGYRTLRWMMQQVVKSTDRFSLLDVGAASGDMGAAIRRWYPGAVVTSFDYRVHHLAAAAHPKLVGDAFAMPFAESSFDLVFSSLFLHHFENEQVIQLLNTFSRLARRAVLAIDLERGPLVVQFVPATKWLFDWDPITFHDAPISVRAAFKRDELLSLAHRAGLSSASVRVHRPWSRLSLIAPQQPGR
jgi:hypothetical protein